MSDYYHSGFDYRVFKFSLKVYIYLQTEIAPVYSHSVYQKIIEINPEGKHLTLCRRVANRSWIKGALV